MRFLAFVTNNAEREKIAAILQEAGIAYKEEIQKSRDEKARGCTFFVKDSDFDRADELLSIPDKDFTFEIIDMKREERMERLAREERIASIRKKNLKRLAINIAVLGLIFFLYALLTRG